MSEQNKNQSVQKSNNQGNVKNNKFIFSWVPGKIIGIINIIKVQAQGNAVGRQTTTKGVRDDNSDNQKGPSDLVGLGSKVCENLRKVYKLIKDVIEFLRWIIW